MHLIQGDRTVHIACMRVKSGQFLKKLMHRLDVFQPKCLRKICRISLKDKINNERILDWCSVC